MISKKEIEKYIELSSSIKKVNDDIQKYTSFCNNDFNFLYDRYPLCNVLLFQYRNKINSWNELLLENYYDKVYIPKSYCKIYYILKDYKKHYDKLVFLRKKYWVSHKEYTKFNNTLAVKIKAILNSTDDSDEKTRLTKFCSRFFHKYNHREGTKNPSKGETLVMNFLDKMAKKYKLYYFYLYRWHFCKDKNALEYDFYCVMIYENRIFQWVIEFDGDQHFRNISRFNFVITHKHDILKQYYLAELNIHLLRLNKQSDINKSIVDFVNQILVSDKYVIVNKINPIQKLFKDESEHDGLKCFNKFIDKMETIQDKLNNFGDLAEILESYQKNPITNFIDLDEINAVELCNTSDNDENILLESNEDDNILSESNEDDNILSESNKNEDDYMIITEKFKEKNDIVEEISSEIDEDEIYQIVYGDDQNNQNNDIPYLKYKTIVESDSEIDEDEIYQIVYGDDQNNQNNDVPHLKCKTITELNLS
jgi:hypothetical protein